MKRLVALWLAVLLAASVQVLDAQVLPSDRGGLGSGTVGRLAKWATGATLGDSLLSDDGANVTLTSAADLLSDTDNASDLFSATTRGRSAYLGTSLFVNTTNAGNGANVVATNANNTAAPAYMILRGSRGTIASPTASQDTDQIGWLSFRAHDGTAWRETALLGAIVEGATGSGDLPTRLSLYSTPDGSATAVERWRISPPGHWLAATDNSYDLGDGTHQVRSGYFGTSLVVAGQAGQSATVTVRDAAGTGTCTLVYTGGIKTGGTC